MTSDPGTPKQREPQPDAEDVPAEARSESDAILPFGVGERLDEIAQERFNRTDWIELVAAVILALATIVAAWSAYQATRWGGEQAKATKAALSAKTDAAQQMTIFGASAQVDVQLWTMWLQQRADENEVGAAFMEERFRDEFSPAFDAWIALAPDGEPPPGTPFQMEEYAPAAEAEAERLNAEADVFAEASAEANQTGDNFVLTAVMMASVLFFAGVGTKLKSRAARLLMLGFAILLFLGGLIFMLSLPQSVGI
jgi:hypothetical protein